MTDCYGCLGGWVTDCSGCLGGWVTDCSGCLGGWVTDCSCCLGGWVTDCSISFGGWVTDCYRWLGGWVTDFSGCLLSGFILRPTGPQRPPYLWIPDCQDALRCNSHVQQQTRRRKYTQQTISHPHTSTPNNIQKMQRTATMIYSNNHTKQHSYLATIIHRKHRTYKILQITNNKYQRSHKAKTTHSDQ